MQTQEEIKKRFEESGGFLRFSRDVLVDYLDYDTAKALGIVKDGVDRSQWDERATGGAGYGPTFVGTISSDDDAKQQLAAYLEFGQVKALDMRGISASRTIDKVREWLWLLGDHEGVAYCNDDNYPQYGAPIIAWVAERYGVELEESDTWADMVKGIAPFDDGW